MKAFVTGGTGFIGGSLVRLLLSEGHSVRLFSRRQEIPPGLDGRSVELIHGNLEDFSSVARAMEGSDVFYHVGEIKNVSKAASRKNVELLRHITRNLPPKGVGRLVFVSSITVAGIPASLPATEETPPAVVLGDHYTSYKRRCERLLSETTEGEYAVIRPAPVYGPGSRYLGRLISAVRNFGPICLPFPGDGRNLAPLIYVDDLARAIYLAGVRPAASGQIFNITDGTRHSWFDFFSAIAESSGRKLRIFRIPPLLLKASLSFLDPFSTFFGIDMDSPRYVTYFSENIYFDNEKTRTVLGWAPRVDLQEGVKEMIREYDNRLQ